jgi:hypothetical protein
VEAAVLGEGGCGCLSTGGACGSRIFIRSDWLWCILAAANRGLWEGKGNSGREACSKSHPEDDAAAALALAALRDVTAEGRARD